MKTIPSLTLIALASILASGCGNKAGDALVAEMNEKLGKQLDLVDRKNDLIKDRMAVLENDNREMRKTLDRILAQLENPADLTNQVASILELQVESLIESQLAEKIGDDPAASMAPESIRTEIAAYEEEKRAAAEAERERQRAEWEAEREQQRQERLATMAGELGITDQQLEQIKVAQQTMQKGLGDLFSQMREGDLPREERESAFQGLREAHETIVGEFLSEEQATAYLEKYSRGAMFGGAGRGGFGRDGRPGGGPRRGPGGGPGGGQAGGGQR